MKSDSGAEVGEGSIPKLDLKFTQVFGDKASADKVSEEDIISAIQFDKTGKYISLGNSELSHFERERERGKEWHQAIFSVLKFLARRQREKHHRRDDTCEKEVETLQKVLAKMHQKSRAITRGRFCGLLSERGVAPLYARRNISAQRLGRQDKGERARCFCHLSRTAVGGRILATRASTARERERERGQKDEHNTGCNRLQNLPLFHSPPEFAHPPDRSVP